MSELLPCPFCGGEARVSNETTCGYETFWVHCLGCHSQANYGHTEAEAIAAWNTRAERTCENVDKYATDGFFICGNCGFGNNAIELTTNYCPNCGARVVGE